MQNLLKLSMGLIISFICIGLFTTTNFALSSYSAQEVSTHNSESSCWMTFDSEVYDLTNYISSHDKYLEIGPWCGKDMTEDFMTKDGTGVDHKASSYSLLSIYKIGTLNITTTPIIQTNSVTTTTSTEEHSSTEEEEFSVEIEGDLMKTLTIQQISDLWNIDSNTLLSEIVKTYKFKNPYTVQTVLGDMRVEYKFSPSQIKEIAEGIKNGTIVSISIPNLNSTSNSTDTDGTNQPYNFVLPFLGTILAYVGSYLVVKNKWGGKKFNLMNFNFFWNSVLVLSLVSSVVFGFYLILRYSIPALAQINFDFQFWHVEGSIIFGTIVVLHLIQRLKQYIMPINLLKK